MNNDIPYGYVYKITNKINGKSYIGMRKLSLDKRWRQYLGSGKLILQAISKYGEENFVKTLVCYAFNPNELQEVEWQKIQHFKSIGEAQYNVFTGLGAGGDTFALLFGKHKEEVLKRKEEGYKRSMVKIKKKRKILREKKYKDFFNENKEKIKNSYSTTLNTNKTASELNLNKSLVSRVAKDLRLSEIFKKEIEEKRVNAQKLYYKSKAREPHYVFCNFCGIDFIYKDSKFCSKKCKESAKKLQNKALLKFNPSYDELFNLWIIKDKNIKEIMEYLGCKNRTVYYLLDKNNLPTTKREARIMREKLFPSVCRKCFICSGDIPKHFKGKTCSPRCRAQKVFVDSKST